MSEETRHDLTGEESAKLEGLLDTRSALSSFSSGYQAGYDAAMRSAGEVLQLQIELVGARAGKRLKLDPRSSLLDAGSKQIVERPKKAVAANGTGRKDV